MRCSQCAAGRRNAKTPSTLPYVPGGCWVLGRLLRDCHNRNFTLFYSPSPCGRNGRFSSFAFLIPTTFIWSGFTWKPGNPTQRSRRSFPNGLSLYHTVLCITDVSTFRLNSLSCCFYVPPGRVCTKGICMCIKLCYIVCQIIRSVAAPPVWLPGAYTPCRPLRWYYAPVHMHKIHIHNNVIVSGASVVRSSELASSCMVTCSHDTFLYPCTEMPPPRPSSHRTNTETPIHSLNRTREYGGATFPNWRYF